MVAKQLMAETGKTKCKWWARVDGKRSDMHCTGTRDVLPRRRVITGHSWAKLQVIAGQFRPITGQPPGGESVSGCVGGWMDGWVGGCLDSGWVAMVAKCIF